MEPEEREEVRAAGAQDARASRVLAGLERDPADDGTVVLSGRCGGCGYMLDSAGHKISCA